MYRIGKYRGRPNYYVIWTENGKTERVSTGTTDRREAEQYLRDFITGISAPPPPDRITIADAIGRYQASLPEHKARRRDWNLRSVVRHIGHYRVDEINRPMCRAYKDKRLVEKPRLSASTLHDELAGLRSALLFCERENIIFKAPFVEVPSPSPARERWLTLEEVGRLLTACLQLPHLWLFTMLALNTGARAGAILDLDWKQVDLATQIIDFNVPGRPRNRKGRAIVPMSDALYIALSSTPEEARTGRVIKWVGRPVLSVKKAFAAACARAGLVGVTPHILRHTFATHAAMTGIDMRKLSKFLGHENERTTASVYAKHSPDYLRDVARVVRFGAPPQNRGTNLELVDGQRPKETTTETKARSKKP